MSKPAVLIAHQHLGAVGALLSGAEAALTGAGATFEVVSLPGALELPLGLELLAEAARAAGHPYSAAVVLGCVIRGKTYHFEIVSNESSRGIVEVALRHRLPLGNGILTVENEEQATVRADPARGDKGGDAARAALALLRLKRTAEQP